MNGFTAADMSTAAANGFRDGLAAQPAAAHETVGVDAYDDAMDHLWKLAGGNDSPVYKLFLGFRDSFSAPVAAAPVECGNCHDGKSDMDHDCPKCSGSGVLPSAPAAPGIDVATVVRSCCEAEQADPDHPDTICINVNDLTVIMQQCVIAASPKGGSMSDCPIIRLAPGEYTDWEKRVWRRGVIECATQSDIAAAMQPTSHGAGVSGE